jgi:NADP-dependent 3-hydroxy acid dehydrogenase YdfG
MGKRVVVVTGGTSGIGRAVVQRAAQDGARVVVVARTRVDAVAAEVSGVGVEADVATEEGVARIRTAVRGLGDGTPDVIVHAAGAFELAQLAEMDVASFDRMIGVNLRAAFLLVRAFVPGMLERGSGDVVGIGSIAGRQAFAANGGYSASKFGVRGLFAVLAAELRGTGVRATFVEPAATDTALWDAVDRERNPGLPQRSAMLPAEAVADAVWYAVTRPGDVAIPNILMERS